MKRPIWMAVSHYSVLIFLAILCLAPLWVIFATSFRQQVDIFAEPLNFIFMPTLENYRAVIADDKLDRYLANRLFVGIVSTAITLVLGTGDFTLKFGDFALGGIGTATFGAIVLWALLGRR